MVAPQPIHTIVLSVVLISARYHADGQEQDMSRDFLLSEVPPELRQYFESVPVGGGDGVGVVRNAHPT